MPEYKLFVRDKNDQALAGFTASVLRPNGTPWMYHNEPIPQGGLEFCHPTKAAQTKIYVHGPGNLLQPHFHNWNHRLVLNLQKGGDIVVRIDDCEDIDCGPCAATRAKAGEQVLNFQPAEQGDESAKQEEEQAKSTSPVVYGSLKPKCVDVVVTVVDAADAVLRDYLCSINAHDFPALTVTKEVGGGVTFRIRSANGAYYAQVWKAGVGVVTSHQFNPEDLAVGGSVSLTIKV